MRKTLSIIFVCIFASFACASQKLAEEISNKFKSSQILSIDISQEKYVSLMDEKIFSKILLVADAKGNVRWQNSSPFESISILKGKNIFNFEKQNGKWTRVKSVADAQIANLFKKISKMALCDFSETIDFDVKYGDNKAILTPKSDVMKRAIANIEILMNKKKIEPISIRVNSIDGDYTLMRIEKISENPKFAKDPFNTENLDDFLKSKN